MSGVTVTVATGLLNSRILLSSFFVITDSIEGAIDLAFFYGESIL